ncbi:MAG: hypothetical protein AAGF23_01610, partial [Acidobacteriota bacterium]
ASAGTLAPDCAGPYVESTSETAEWTVPGEKTCFSTYFDDKTLWFVRAESDVLSDGVTLGLPSCSRGKDIRVVERTLDSLLLEIRGAGWRSVCVSQANRTGDPVAVKLVARALGAFETDDPHEQDPDPDPLTGGECGGRQLATKTDDPHEQDPDPDPLMGGECGGLSTVMQVCRAAGEWGRRHMPSCAVTSIADRWIDTQVERMIRIDVGAWQRLEIETVGESELAVRNSLGHRLAKGQLSSLEGHRLLEVSVAPGSYWLEAAGDNVRYRLTNF